MRITDATGTREIDVATGSAFGSDVVKWHEDINVGNSICVLLIIEPK